MSEPQTIETPKIGVMIATPVKFYAREYIVFSRLIEDLRALSVDPSCPYEFVWATIDMGVVPARNKLVANFRKSECRWLCFVDYDVEISAADILRLLSKKLPVIGGLYTTKEKNPHWVATFLFEAQAQKETVVQVVELGTGAGKLYHREVFDQLEKAFPQVVYTDRDTGERLFGFFQHAVVVHDMQMAGDLLPEDYFCDFLCRMAQISVWCDTSIKLKHRGGNGVLYPEGAWPAIPCMEKA